MDWLEDVMARLGDVVAWLGAICNVWKDREKKQETEGKLSNTGKIKAFA